MKKIENKRIRKHVWEMRLFLARFVCACAFLYLYIDGDIRERCIPKSDAHRIDQVQGDFFLF